MGRSPGVDEARTPDGINLLAPSLTRALSGERPLTAQCASHAHVHCTFRFRSSRLPKPSLPSRTSFSSEDTDRIDLEPFPFPSACLSIRVLSPAAQLERNSSQVPVRIKQSNTSASPANLECLTCPYLSTSSNLSRLSRLETQLRNACKEHQKEPPSTTPSTTLMPAACLPALNLPCCPTFFFCPVVQQPAQPLDAERQA